MRHVLAGSTGGAAHEGTTYNSERGRALDFNVSEKHIVFTMSPRIHPGGDRSCASHGSAAAAASYQDHVCFVPRGCPGELSSVAGLGSFWFVWRVLAASARGHLEARFSVHGPVPNLTPWS